MKGLMNFVAISALATLMVNCSNKKEETAIASIPVKSMAVEDVQITQSDPYIGTVVESQSSVLSFEVPGHVKQVLVSEGQKVTKGQLLAVLNKGNIANNYSAVTSTLRQAQDTYSRTAMLYKSKSIPKIQYIDAKTQLEKARSAEQSARKDMKDCYLYAPFSGVIGERSIDPGTNIAAGFPAFKLLETNILKAKVAIPENKMRNIRIGDKVQVKINALNNLIIQGSVNQKGVIGNPLSHTYEIKIILVNPPKEVMPGMLCDVTISSDSDPHLIIIPANCIQLFENNNRYVWVINNNKVHLRQVSIGAFSQNGIIIRNGLTSGEHIVIEGFQKISEGCLVVEK